MERSRGRTLLGLGLIALGLLMLGRQSLDFGWPGEQAMPALPRIAPFEADAPWDEEQAERVEHQAELEAERLEREAEQLAWQAEQEAERMQREAEQVVWQVEQEAERMERGAERMEWHITQHIKSGITQLISMLSLALLILVGLKLLRRPAGKQPRSDLV